MAFSLRDDILLPLYIYMYIIFSWDVDISDQPKGSAVQQLWELGAEISIFKEEENNK